MSFPSDQQKEVIIHSGKPMIVVAGPGTGKTETLVARIIHLLKEDKSREVSFITFTRASRRDTYAKLESELGEDLFNQHLIFPRISTLHKYAKSLVHKYAYEINRKPNFSMLIDDNGEKTTIVEDLIYDLNINIDNKTLSKGISCILCTDKWPQNFQLSINKRIEVLTYYDDLIRFYETFDMESLVWSACEILSDWIVPTRRLYLQVDEYQDLNPKDQQLISLIVANTGAEVIVVADDAQSIYSQRHANFAGVRTLWESDDWEKVHFPDSHRLPAHILNAALDLIADEEYLGSKINRKPPNNKKITTFRCTTPTLQSGVVASKIKELKNSSIEEINEQITYKDFLVLCPTNRLVTNVLRSLQDEYGIPAFKRTAPNIPNDYWKLLLILRVLNDKDPLALRQWLPMLSFNIEEIHDLRYAAMENGQRFYDHCESIDDPRFIKFFAELSILSESLNDVTAFTHSLEKIKGLPTQNKLHQDFTELREKTGRLSPQRLIQLIYEKFGIYESEEIIPDDDMVLVATLHSAKGLEANYVFCMWMNRTHMPLENCDIDEQKRLLYVALTRAKKDVYITFYEEYNPTTKRRIREKALSPFLLEIRNHLEITRIRTEDIEKS